MKNTNIVLKVNGVPWMYSNMLVFVVLEWTTGWIAVDSIIHNISFLCVFILFLCITLFSFFFFTVKQNNRYYNGFIQI